MIHYKTMQNFSMQTNSEHHKNFAYVHINDLDEFAKVCKDLKPYILNFQQMTLLLYHFGFKITSKFITRWPAIAILPCFGPFVFSGEDHDNKKVLTVSQMWTFVNTSLNISCSTFGIFLVFYLLLGGDGFCFLDLGFMCAGEISVVASIPLLGLSLILCIIIFCSERCCVITQRTGCHIVEDDSLVMVDLDSNKNNEEGLAMHNI